jgi:hypothetical protein
MWMVSSSSRHDHTYAHFTGQHRTDSTIQIFHRRDKGHFFTGFKRMFCLRNQFVIKRFFETMILHINMTDSLYLPVLADGRYG